MITRLSRLGVFLLGMSFASALLIVYAWRHRAPSVPSMGPMRGMSLPKGIVTDKNGDTTTLAQAIAQSRCAVVTIMSIHCAHCSRMRVTHPSVSASWLDSIPGTPDFYWVFGESTVDVSEFLMDTKDLNVRSFTWAEPVDSLVHRFGIIGTPTGFLVNGNGEIRWVTFGPNLPPAGEAVAACAS